VGYFLWPQACLRISHKVLTNLPSEGGLNLKDLKLQGLALRINRTLQLICHHDTTFSYAYLHNILSHIETVAPLNIQPWKHFNYLFNDVYIELTYILIQQLPIDDFTTQKIYLNLLVRPNRPVPPMEAQFPDYQWSQIYNNIYSLRQYESCFNTWYKIIHQVYPNNARLHELDISKDDTCTYCREHEDIRHLITQCRNNGYIWQQYLKKVAIVLHTSVPQLNFDELITFPYYRYFPPKKKKFLLWLTAQTLEFALKRPDYHTAQCYVPMLQFQLSQMSPEIIVKNFARFYTVLEM
jgi:hypothetical protein